MKIKMKYFCILTAMMFVFVGVGCATRDAKEANVQLAKKHETQKAENNAGKDKVKSPNPGAPEPITIATVIEISGFSSWSSELDAKAKDYLKKKAKELQDKGYGQITITGHTDNEGEFLENKRLSLERADNVAKFLIGQGIDEKKIKTRGKSFDKPKEGNATEEGRSHNRRVVIKIKQK
jgi:outer membrane protein OmpA-like peptidoglycan-associated protein